MLSTSVGQWVIWVTQYSVLKEEAVEVLASSFSIVEGST
jgi:hypothetical protein